MKKLVSDYQLLTQEWNKKPSNHKKCAEILRNLKVALTQVNFLPSKDGTATKQELLVARDILEIGAQWAIAGKNIPAFEAYMAQLKCYYLDYKEELPESAYRYQLLGLNLLRLLAQNKLADFHTELELLPAKDLQSNVYIKHPVSMEQYLMEGSYNKVFLAKGSVPAESYIFFMDILLSTIRDEIANCIEKAYEKISFTEACRMLFFEKPKDMQEYGVKKSWQLGADQLYHFVLEERKLDDHVPSTDLAQQVISYARELETIV